MRFTNQITLFFIFQLALSPIAVFSQQRNGAASKTETRRDAGFRQPAEQITAAQLKDYLSFIASDELEGRDTPSRGLNIAAKFIATNLSRWGVKGAGDQGSYFQKIDLRLVKFDTAKSRAEFGGQTMKLGTDFLAQPIPAAVSGSLVYAGHGWVVKSKNINPYQGIDVKDKIVVVSSVRRPKSINAGDVPGEAGGEWDNPITYASRNGAKAVVAVPTFQELSSWDRSHRTFADKGVLTMPSLHRATRTNLPVITPSIAMLNALFRGEKLNGSDVFNCAVNGEASESFDLAVDKRLDLTIDVASENVVTQNVVAVIEGSDPQLKNEYVALGAHYDHVGVGSQVNGDAIYNGADDDGSGTVALLAMAEALSRGPRPKRSLLFVWHAGEEKGLWGSRYFTEFPTVALNQIVAQINIDMIGRSRKEGDTNPLNKNLSGPNEIYVIGSKMMSSELGAISDKVNDSYLKLLFNFKYDAVDDPERLFFRSDHYSYAQKGIPIIFYFSGVHEDYHRPGDSVDEIDFAKYERVTRTIFATAWTLADAAAKPKVDKKLPAELTGAR